VWLAQDGDREETPSLSAHPPPTTQATLMQMQDNHPPSGRYLHAALFQVPTAMCTARAIKEKEGGPSLCRQAFSLIDDLMQSAKGVGTGSYSPAPSSTVAPTRS
jgi:hypothetical protein